MIKSLKTISAICVLICCGLFIACSDNNDDEFFAPAPEVTSDVLFQVRTLGGLIDGEYDGVMSYSDLAAYGDFGIGTFDGLDGEMVMVDGVFYQVKVDGVAYSVAGTMTAPFAMVTFFEADTTFELNESLNYQQLQQRLDDILQANDTFLAIKVTGTFSYLKRRSVPKQSKPYPTLEVALENQAIFEEYDQTFTLAGYRMPDYIQEINNPGYHLHCLSGNGQTGGHVLDCTLNDVSVEIDYTGDFYMVSPE